MMRCKRCEHFVCQCTDGCTVYQGDVSVIADALREAGVTVDMVFGSPPYCDARTYGIDAQRRIEDWIDWMATVTMAWKRICRGPICWVVAGVTRDRKYWPAPEGLLWTCYQLGIPADPPCFWYRRGIPGSGGDQGFRRDVEYILVFKPTAKLPYADNKADGKPPVYDRGGGSSHYRQDGSRARGEKYPDVEIANPGNWIDADNFQEPIVVQGNVGGGHMGDDLAHKNEAAFPEYLPKWFILTWCPPGGLVCDPFCGSGTTLAVARRLGRHAIGSDIRESQCALTVARLAQQELFTSQA